MRATRFILLLLIGGVSFFGSTANAQVTNNGESKWENLRCYESSSYFVVAKENQGSAGTDFLIKEKSRKSQAFPCEYLVIRNDFEIKNQNAEYFLKLAGNRLVLDSGTGPDLRDLIVWDLSKQKKVYTGQYSGPLIMSPRRIGFWGERRSATKKECSSEQDQQKDGLRIAVETKVLLSLSNLSAKVTNKTRCISIQ
jgi:hypothetical protein